MPGERPRAHGPRAPGGRVTAMTLDHISARLPVLASLARDARLERRARSFLVTHVLETAVPYLEIVHEAFPIEAVVAIPYSAEKSAVSALRATGIEVVTPTSIAEAHHTAGDMLQRALCRSTVPLVVQE